MLLEITVLHCPLKFRLKESRFDLKFKLNENFNCFITRAICATIRVTYFGAREK